MRERRKSLSDPCGVPTTPRWLGAVGDGFEPEGDWDVSGFATPRPWVRLRRFLLPGLPWCELAMTLRSPQGCHGFTEGPKLDRGWHSCHVITVTHHRPEVPEEFAPAASHLLDVLSGTAGFVAGSLSRSPDDPANWLLILNWADAGSMRRGMSGYEAKVALAPVMVSAADQLSVFEPLVTRTPQEAATVTSDRHPAADSTGPGSTSLL